MVDKGKKKKKKVVQTIKTKKPVVVKKRRKVNFRRVFFFLSILLVLFLVFFLIQKLPITNIYIRGNQAFSDQEIIELAQIENYPSSFSNSKSKIKKRLEKEQYIKSAKVKKKWFTSVTIVITENRPLFRKQTDGQVVLLDHSEVTASFAVPTLINYVPDTIYQKFIEAMGLLDQNVAKRISEIKYDPNKVDDHRFLLTMDDENLVYITIEKFENLNNYIEIIRKFENQKGVLYLDYGTRFEILEK